MKALASGLVFLVACRAAGVAPATDAGVPELVASVHDQRLQVPHTRDPPPAGERVASIPAGMKQYESLRPPPVIPGHPPSVKHPLGTVFVAAYRGFLEDDGPGPTPYVAEWDLANESLVYEWVDRRVGTFTGGVPQIAFDGASLYVLTEWAEGPQREGAETRELCRMAVLDEKMHDTRTKRVPCGAHLTLGRGSELLVTDYVVADEGETMIFRRLDPSLRVRATAAFPVLPMPLTGPSPPVHAGDSFYSLVGGADGAQHVVRLDDRSLRERARSPSLGPADGTCRLAKADDRWVVSCNESRWNVSPELAVVEVDQRSLGTAAEAWQGGRILSTETSPPGSSVYLACEPLWAFATPLFACASNDQLTIVRPAFDDVPRADSLPTE